MWHADSGTMVSTHTLKDPITCLIEVRNFHSQFLLGSDASGLIATWNLTLFKLKPSVIVLERVIDRRHDPGNPGIGSLAFHDKSGTCFSGGDDCTIRAWILQQEGHGVLEFKTIHREAICKLCCTDRFLLSGDGGGEIILWRLIDGPDDNIGARIQHPCILCKWNNFIDYSDAPRAICTMLEVIFWLCYTRFVSFKL
jgi:WD40 repeat protein